MHSQNIILCLGPIHLLHLRPGLQWLVRWPHDKAVCSPQLCSVSALQPSPELRARKVLDVVDLFPETVVILHRLMSNNAAAPQRSRPAAEPAPAAAWHWLSTGTCRPLAASWPPRSGGQLPHSSRRALQHFFPRLNPNLHYSPGRGRPARRAVILRGRK